MGCDICNYKVLKIKHTVNDVNLDEIIVLNIDEIYVHGTQYDEEIKTEIFWRKVIIMMYIR